MSDVVSGLSGILHSPAFYQAVILAIVAWVLRSDSAQLVLRGIGNAILAFFKRRLPANQYAVLKKLAEDAVTYAWQQGQHASWTSEQKASEAQAYLKAAARAHGLGGLASNATLLTGVIETVWHEIKPAVVEAAASAEDAARALAIATPPADAGSPFSYAKDVAPGQAATLNSAPGDFKITYSPGRVPLPDTPSSTAAPPAAPSDQTVSASEPATGAQA